MQDIPYGYCHCGCGQKTKIADATRPRDGWVKGEPLRYVMNHHRRKPVDEYWVEEDRGYASPCWVWQGNTRDGYGRIFREGRLWNAHRWYYEQARGSLPEGTEMDHLCRVRACVNPDHLEPVTRTTNIQRGYKARGKPTHCKHGHEYTPENTLVDKDGAWRCRECQKANMRRYYERHKERWAKRIDPPSLS